LTGTFTGKIDTMEAECFAANMLSSKNGAVAFIGAFNESGRGQNPLLYAFSKNVNESKNIRLGDAFLSSLNSEELPETVKKYYPHVIAYEYNRARLQFHLFGDPALLINKKTTSIINKVFEQGFKLSPNPASDYIEISLDRCATLAKCGTSETDEIKIYNTFGEEDIKIYTSIGEIVITESIHPMTSSHRMNTERLPLGLYFIQIGNYSVNIIVLR